MPASFMERVRNGGRQESRASNAKVSDTIRFFPSVFAL